MAELSGYVDPRHIRGGVMSEALRHVLVETDAMPSLQHLTCFIVVNNIPSLRLCTSVGFDLLSVPDDLQLAELVGWKRGAFTGATHNMAGALTRASGGTLFIDEIDKLSLKAQAGLLRILEERHYRALGDGTEEQRANVQFIVGTNVDLQRSVWEGRFREDLYYRINVLPLRLPPLAERLDEVPGWAGFMLQRCSEGTEGRSRLTQEAIAALGRHPWPGNLRQLDNVVRRAHAFARAGRGPAGGEVVRWWWSSSSTWHERWRSRIAPATR